VQEYVIVYSHRDEEFVQRLSLDLKGRIKTATIFFDRLKDADASWTATMAVKLSRASLVLVALSPNLLASSHAKDELALVQRQQQPWRSPPISLLLQPCSAPGWLGDLQSIDFTNGYEAGLKRLVRNLTVRRSTFLGGAVVGLLLGAVAGVGLIHQWSPAAILGAVSGASFSGSFGEARAGGNASDVAGGSVVLGGLAGILAAVLYRPWGWWSLAIPVVTGLLATGLSWLGFWAGRVWGEIRGD